MKKTILIIAILLYATSFVDAAAAPKIQQQIQQNAQFQIVPVEYHSLNTNGDNIKKAVLKIDVFTGKTWILQDSTYKTSEGKINVNRGWEELELSIQADYPRK